MNADDTACRLDAIRREREQSHTWQVELTGGVYISVLRRQPQPEASP